jgi:hypothetical protein
MIQFLAIQIKLGKTTLDAVRVKFGETSGMYLGVAALVS